MSSQNDLVPTADAYRSSRYLFQVEAIKDDDLIMDFENHEKGEASLLQMAANYNADDEVIIKLAKKFPSLIALQRNNEFEGQTVLHTFISQQKLGLVRKVLNIMKTKKPNELPTLLLTKVEHCMFMSE